MGPEEMEGKIERTVGKEKKQTEREGSLGEQCAVRKKKKKKEKRKKEKATEIWNLVRIGAKLLFLLRKPTTTNRNQQLP